MGSLRRRAARRRARSTCSAPRRLRPATRRNRTVHSRPSRSRGPSSSSRGPLAGDGRIEDPAGRDDAVLALLVTSGVERFAVVLGTVVGAAGLLGGVHVNFDILSKLDVRFDLQRIGAMLGACRLEAVLGSGRDGRPRPRRRTCRSGTGPLSPASHPRESLEGKRRGTIPGLCLLLWQALRASSRIATPGYLLTV